MCNPETLFDSFWQISYTYGDVIATLAMIETSTNDTNGMNTAQRPVVVADSKDQIQDQTRDTELQRPRQVAITSKLRTAIKHLRQVAGPLSPFRGFHIAIIYHALHNLVLNFAVSPQSASLIRALISILVTVVLHRIHMVWTHTVISMPANKSWWKRILPFKLSKTIILPTAIWAAAQQICLYFPRTLFAATYQNIHQPRLQDSGPSTVQKVALIQSIAILAIFIITIFLIVIPAEVSLKRVEASLLPETDQTIVPFDRSFAGKAQPNALGGPALISVLDAWRTFGKEGRIRLVKLYGKVFAIQVALAILFTMIIAGELRVLSGHSFSTLIEAARSSLKVDL